MTPGLPPGDPPPPSAEGRWGHQVPQQPHRRAVTLEVVTFAIHEDVVHEHHAEHAGVDVEVAEDKREVGRLQGREDLGFMAKQRQPSTN